MDASAQNFITATGIANTTIENAIDALCIYLKKRGIWDKMISIYPMVGGTADTHKYNLKNPSNTDEAKRLTFSGGWTHSANGALPNGSTGYADTHVDLFLDVPPYNLHMSYYSRTASIGADDYVILGVGNPPMYIDLFYTNRIYVAVGTAPDYTLVVNPASGFTGLLGFNSINPLGYKVLRGTEVMGENTQNRYVYFPNQDPSNPRTVYLGAFNNNNTANYFAPIECAFSSIGYGLTDNEWKMLNNAVNTFQTSLSRNI